MNGRLILKSAAATMAVIMSATGLCACNGEDENKVNPANNLLASVQKGESAPSYDFNDTAKRPEGYDSYINKIGNISLQLIKQEDYAKSNTITSPAATALMLAGLENAANHGTQKQIKSYLGSSTKTTEEINQSAAYLTQRMSFFNSDDFGIYNVNSLWLSDKLSPKRSFLQKLENYYNMSAYKTDFTADNTEAVIKGFVSDSSIGLINAKSVNTADNYKMYIDCSAAVSDSWLKPYDDSDIKNGSFTNADKSKSDVSFLTSEERTFTSSKAKGFVKDVKNTACKLMCVIPNEDITLEEYIEQLKPEDLIDMANTTSPTKFTSVSLPEFSVSKSESIKSDLDSIGLGEIFKKGADFSKGFSEDIFVDDITQTVSIKIDKNGISAKQAEADETEKQKTDGSLTFDRPFIYAVIDNESNAPIIIGTINKL